MPSITNNWDAVKIMLGLGWGILGMLVLVLAQWTTNDNNLYSSALAFAVIFRRWPKWVLTLGAGVIGILLALGGIYGQFPNWLMFLGVIIPPIAGIYVADYFVVNRDFYNFG
jgi:cytosine permease